MSGVDDKEYHCSTCCKMLPKVLFSKAQFKLGRSKRCTTCVQAIQSAGALGQALLADHASSRGRIDGHKHRPPGRMISNRSGRPKADDFSFAKAAIAAFKEKYNLATWAPSDYAPGSLVCLQPREAYFLPSYACNDFVTTVRPGLIHKPLCAWPNTNPSEFWGVGQLEDAPRMSAVHELRFCCTNPCQFHCSSMSQDSIFSDDGQGTLLLHKDIPVAGKAPMKLPNLVCIELVRVYLELLKLRPNRPRGCKCASICR